MQLRNSRVRNRRADGISEVVGFVIILAVVVAAMSLYLTYAVPVQGREEEITVMDGVRTWFVDYKTSMDQLWLNSPLAPESLEEPSMGEMLHDSTVGSVTLRKVIDPGTAREKGFMGRYLPLLAPIPCSGEMSVRTDGRLNIDARAPNNPNPIPIYQGDAPALVYRSNNYYWFQQEYFYQLGAVFLRQWETGGEKVTLVAAPPLSIYELDEEQGRLTRVELAVLSLASVPGDVGSTSPIRVETRLDGDPDRPVEETAFSNVTLTFEATSPDAAEAWKDAFSGAAARNGIRRYDATSAGSIASITIKGPVDTETNDVLLEMLDARYTMRLENVPTMIE